MSASSSIFSFFSSRSCLWAWPMPLAPFKALQINLCLGWKSFAVFTYTRLLCIVGMYSKIWGIFVLFCLVYLTTYYLLSAPSAISSRSRFTLSAKWLHLVGWHQTLQGVCYPWHGSFYWCLALEFLPGMHKFLWAVYPTECQYMCTFHWFVRLPCRVVLGSPLAAVIWHFQSYPVLCTCTVYCWHTEWFCYWKWCIQCGYWWFCLKTKVMGFNLLPGKEKS